MNGLNESHFSFKCPMNLEDMQATAHGLFCANRKMDGEMLKQYRHAWSHHDQRGKLGRVLYQLADITGLSRRFHEQHFPEVATVARVAHHLDHVLPAWREEIDDVFFGHTHRPFSRHSHEGVLFHNSGSGIRGMGFNPLVFTG